jgi:two-component system KDP operon response regulator KdpE
MDGVQVVQGLRGWTQAPIIILSAREGQADKVEALDAGADDYLTKPFGMDELVAGCAPPCAGRSPARMPP